MIIVGIWEGLGNQLFQYAFARMLKEQGYRVVLDMRTVEDEFSFSRYKNIKRKIELDKFRITLAWTTKKDYGSIFYLFKRNQIEKMFWDIAKKGIGINSYSEQENPYEYEPVNKRVWRNTYYRGWYQNPQYFQHIRKELLSEIRLKEKIKISSQLKTLLQEENLVAVHIRRGDYKFHQACLPIDYYNRAINKMSQLLEGASYLFFSDDLEWVKTQFGMKENYYYMDSLGKYHDYEELMIMSRCKHFIIANSTFSWWGAWLSQNTDKIVIAPKYWFGNKGTYASEQILLSEWIKL